MTIEEAIKHCREVAQQSRRIGKRLSESGVAAMVKEGADCEECANEHEQLAKWLEELQEKRCKVIVQANRIKDLEGELQEERAKRAEAYEKLYAAYAKIDELILEKEEQETKPRACTTCGKRTRCPGPASGRAQTGCSFWAAEEEQA